MTETLMSRLARIESQIEAVMDILGVRAVKREELYREITKRNKPLTEITELRAGMAETSGLRSGAGLFGLVGPIVPKRGRKPGKRGPGRPRKLKK